MAATGREMAKAQESHKTTRWICENPGTVLCSAGSVDVSAVTAISGISVSGDGVPGCHLDTITTDSRKAGPGSLFIALSGTVHDGHDYIGEAVAAGCSAVLVEEGRIDSEAFHDSDTCVLVAADSRKVYTELAELLFLYPAKGMTMFGITGTNGKTSVSYLLESVLLHAGRQPGVLGTINYRYHESDGSTVSVPSSFTTPEPFLLQQTLRLMADSGVDSVVMEISSHGLEQNRIGSLDFDVTAFTNLSRDHLDYHLDMENYFRAKQLLFTEHLRPEGRAVISFSARERHWSEKLRKICGDRGIAVLSCGVRAETDLYPLTVKNGLRKTEITLSTPDGDCSFVSPLVGDFNLANLQTCFAMARLAGIRNSCICEALAAAAGAPGRMQQIPAALSEQPFRPAVFVDYAHTPDALEQVLCSVKELPHGTLYTVFGCGGDRDKGKRPIMGAVASKYADVLILTKDNPRSEDPEIILEEIESGVDRKLRSADWLLKGKTAEGGYLVIADRHQAIKTAIVSAKGDDIVLIAGKGHEDYQLGRQGKVFFDDSLEASIALSRWTIDSLLRATGGRLVSRCGPEKELRNISTDSRTITPTDIFVALKGDRFDAHRYVSQVDSAGAGCLILEREPEEQPAAPVILVNDTEKALGDLARYRRAVIKEMSSPLLAAVTGSSGKTTVKEMCAAIFNERWPDEPTAARGRVLKTGGNFNNLIGLPLSLLPISPRHRAAILEMGMNEPGEIARLTEIADPDIACIVNVHGAHLQGLGDIEGVARAKAELFQGCGPETTLIVNRDDSRVVKIAAHCEQKKIYFGLARHGEPECDLYAVPSNSCGRENVEFMLHVYGEKRPVILQLPGSHNISNALAAAAVAVAAGIGIDTIARGLMAFEPADRRMQILSGPGDCRVINDTYNANPESMKAGLATLKELGRGGRRVAVLGDMLELGPQSAAFHKDTGVVVAECAIDYLAVLGEFAADTAAGAVTGGMAGDRVKTFEKKEDCVCWLNELVQSAEIRSGSYILVKGSRGMQLESLVERFIGEH